MDDLDRRYVEWEKARILSDREAMSLRKDLAERALSKAFEQWAANKDDPFAASQLEKAITLINKARIGELASVDAHLELMRQGVDNDD